MLAHDCPVTAGMAPAIKGNASNCVEYEGKMTFRKRKGQKSAAIFMTLLFRISVFFDLKLKTLLLTKHQNRDRLKLKILLQTVSSSLETSVITLHPQSLQATRTEILLNLS